MLLEDRKLTSAGMVTVDYIASLVDDLDMLEAAAVLAAAMNKVSVPSGFVASFTFRDLTVVEDPK
ncbi:hypothetical protein LJC46_02115 [Desulfovibrio sp. OttesenSCG-928-G15]|nr:hypothetical protein [Desulfovibrio sp. OttesenSCG-928-G15]